MSRATGTDQNQPKSKVQWWSYNTWQNNVDCKQWICCTCRKIRTGKLKHQHLTKTLQTLDNKDQTGLQNKSRIKGQLWSASYRLCSCSSCFVFWWFLPNSCHFSFWLYIHFVFPDFMNVGSQRLTMKLLPQLWSPTPPTWESWTWEEASCRIQEWSSCLPDWRVHNVDSRLFRQFTYFYFCKS